MFPIKDSTPSRTVPFFNWLIIIINIFVFIIELSVPDVQAFIQQYAFVPHEFYPLNPASYDRVLYSMFLHGGWFHLISNMWFLHIFGDNIEDRIGHIRYVLFYLMCGVVSVYAQYVIDPLGGVPMIGASGAVSGVAGAYLAWFSRSRIRALVPTFVGFWDIIELPSWFFLGYWFVIQVFSGVGSLAASQTGSGGVAFFAHIGGFMFGYILAKSLRSPHDTSQDI